MWKTLDQKDVEVGNSTPVRVSVKQHNGHEYVDVRKTYDKDGEYAPSKKGIALTREQWQLILPLLSELVMD